MSRVIKFRGKAVDNGEWLYGWLFKDALRGKPAIQQTTFGKVGDADHMQIRTIAKEVVPESIGQFTGLMSYDGGWGVPSKEAYIGDIIKYVSTEGRVYIKEIKWDDELCCICFGNIPYKELHDSAFHQPSKIQFEIIGNSYENPELLK